MNKIFLSLTLLAINIWLLWRPSDLRLPFVPPLTHTPGMGISLIGTPEEPAFVYIPHLQSLSASSCSQCPKLEAELQQHLTRGKELRLTMYSQTKLLLSLLPDQTALSALKNRDHNEKRIGEVLIWEQLSQH